jgi:hypothetical protein
MTYRALVGLSIVASSFIFARDASAACVMKDLSPALTAAQRIRFVAQPSALLPSNESHKSIVGLWDVTFLVGNGPDIFDQGFQQWHLGGTETMVDNAVSPSFGNVCIGVWKQVGSRTYKLKHVTFNWDAQGKPAGTFMLLMTVRLDRHGNAYSGSYEADSFDLSGNVIPELHVEGVVRAKRITVS